nr:SEC-C metal-binding domain-containing protein [Luteimonas saliphila]
MTLFDGAYGAEPAPVDAPASPDFEERWEILAGVPGLLQYCNEMRQDGVFPQAPRRREAVPGRNDPCPCGSGRKYKKCCGAGVTLH